MEEFNIGAVCLAYAIFYINLKIALRYRNSEIVDDEPIIETKEKLMKFQILMKWIGKTTYFSSTWTTWTVDRYGWSRIFITTPKEINMNNGALMNLFFIGSFTKIFYFIEAKRSCRINRINRITFFSSRVISHSKTIECKYPPIHHSLSFWVRAICFELSIAQNDNLW